MYKLYNEFKNLSTTDGKIYNNIRNFFNEFHPRVHATFITFLPFLISILMQKESVIFIDLASFIAPIYNIQITSAERKIRRFLKSKKNNFYYFYDLFINKLISNFSIKHNNKVHIAYDHMHISDKYTILLFALRIGKVGIPIWFRCFKYNDSDAFQYNLFIEGIDYCHNLLKKYNKDCDIVFLADRFWGAHTKVMEHINSIGDTYYIRAKGNLLVYLYDEKTETVTTNHLSDLPTHKHSSVFTKNRYKVNLAISNTKDHKEPYYIITNANPSTAIKEYSKRFGTAEFNFKNEKTNGFFLEETQLQDLKSLEGLFTCVCIAQVLLTILGIDFSKNNGCFNDIKITTTKLSSGKRIRIYSYFHIGLLIISYTIKSIKPINLFKRIILYDV